MDLIKVMDSDICTKAEEKVREQLVDVVDIQFKEMMDTIAERVCKALRLKLTLTISAEPD